LPLNEECGIIEWVPHTSGLRQILNKYYSKYWDPKTKIKELTTMQEKSKMPLVEFYEKHLMVLTKPSVLHKWFKETFQEPSSWWSSRLNYSRSCAVMSMIGYLVGLGDRHGENIMLDSTNGDVVHVDFDCLFSKGLTFEKPEKVPFRLTHNIIDGMGLTGYEGTFRSVCEKTLHVLRSNRETLLSVLETFIYDPLVEWTKKDSKVQKRNANENENSNQRGVDIVNEINDRLQGIVGPGLPLSVQGQVHLQIEEATSVNNLAVMYIGWAAYC